MRGMRECADDAYDTTPGGKPRAKVYGAKGLRAIRAFPRSANIETRRLETTKRHLRPKRKLIRSFGFY